MFGHRATIADMPKRKTAETKIETAVTAADSKQHSKSRLSPGIVSPDNARKNVKSPAHKRTTAKKAVPPAPVVAPIAAHVVASPELDPVPVVVAMPAHAAVAQLAYSYFVERGYQPGNPCEDWLRAERELTKLS
ncbi:MAG: DUF2934 domain-containing protein [Bryobacteraceae bacterium]|nr:DUF2934 domain-containing protein [Bryobacteraceae bacterium]